MKLSDLIATYRTRPRANKFHAHRTLGYASKKEARRAAELHLLASRGLITALREQVPFELIPAQRAPDGTLLERPCSYVADFVYRDPSQPDADGQPSLVVEDTKGLRTPEYIIKRKLLLFRRHIRIREI